MVLLLWLYIILYYYGIIYYYGYVYRFFHDMTCIIIKI